MKHLEAVIYHAASEPPLIVGKEPLAANANAGLLAVDEEIPIVEVPRTGNHEQPEGCFLAGDPD